MLTDLHALRDFLDAHPRLFVLTGAGCSTESGIPDYRDEEGAWKRRQPVQYFDFVRRPEVRQRYWARSFAGWPRFAEARPNEAHLALAGWQAAGRLHCLVTQNVDGLHQRAGSRDVIDLHGRLDTVHCLTCRASLPRDEFQEALAAANPAWPAPRAMAAPDGDADLEGADYASFIVPDCPTCAGILKPAVVFFGESVPPDRVALCLDRLGAADALLVVGSSLMVRSGYRFALAAHERGIPVAAVNRGRTRADDLLALKVEGNCADILGKLVFGHTEETETKRCVQRT